MNPQTTTDPMHGAGTTPVMQRAWDREGRLIVCDQGWHDVTGSALQADWLAPIHPDDRDACVNAVLRTLRTNRPVLVDYRLRRADGLYRPVRERLAPRGAGGQTDGCEGTCIDLTDWNLPADATAALTEERDKYRRIVETTAVAIVQLDYRAVRGLAARLRAEGVRDVRAYLASRPVLLQTVRDQVHVLDMNEHARWLLGAQAAEALLPPSDDAFIDHVIALVKNRESLETETTIRGAEDVPYDVLYSIRFPGPSDPDSSAIVSALDITARKRAERQLRASEARYRTVVEHQTELIRRYLPDTTLTFVNEAYCRYFGRRREELIGRPFIEFVPEDSRAGVLRTVQRLTTPHTPLEMRLSEHEVMLPDGTIRWQQWADHTIVDDSGRVLEVQGIGHDVTDRKRTETALLASERALRQSRHRVADLAGRLLRAQEEERRRISRELHDDLNQNLAALAIALSALRRKTPEHDTTLRNDLARLHRRTAELSEHVRRLSHHLHPAVVEHGGLVPALQAFCEDFAAGTGIEIAAEIEQAPDGLAPEAAVCVYRVAQEALRNVERHSRSARARLRLGVDDQLLVLEVEDDGCGFSPDAEPARGLGLVSIQERVRLLHGDVTVISAPGRGTRLVVWLPTSPPTP